jgi:hypothetical protein
MSAGLGPSLFLEPFDKARDAPALVSQRLDLDVVLAQLALFGAAEGTVILFHSHIPFWERSIVGISMIIGHQVTTRV